MLGHFFRGALSQTSAKAPNKLFYFDVSSGLLDKAVTIIIEREAILANQEKANLF